MDYSRWMELTTRIHGLPLGQICLPATHDTGTYASTDVLCPYDQDLIAAITDFLKAVVGWSSALEPYYGQLESSAIQAVKGLATTTGQDVAAQLAAGIRGLDLRIAYDDTDGAFKTYHGLWGATLAEVLDQVANFLGKKNGGEIVYLNFSHFKNCDGKMSDFAQQVGEKLGYRVFPPTWDFSQPPVLEHDLFRRTYQQIVGGSGSKAILVWDQDAAGDKFFWPRPYCPIDDTRQASAIAGSYENTDETAVLMCDQADKLKNAIAASLPFALFMTLIPSADTYQTVIERAVAEEAVDIGEQIGGVTGQAILSAAKGFLALLPPTAYTTLYQLSQTIDRRLERLVAEYLLPLTPGTSDIAMLFLDYYEETEVTALAIDLSGSSLWQWESSQTIEQASGGKYSPKSVNGPGAGVFEGMLHVAYPDDTGLLWEALYQSGQGWVANGLIVTADGSGLFSDKSPALAEFDGQLYLVYRHHGGDGDQNNGKLYQSRFSQGQWTTAVAISSISPIDPRSNRGPSIAVYQEKLYLVYKGESDDDHQIYLATLAPGAAWQGGTPIGNLADSTVKNGETTQRPGLAAFGRDLYLIYKDRHGNSLRQALLAQGSWSGGSKIGDLEDSDIDPQSDRGPAAIAAGGQLYLFYEGVSGPIYQSQLALGEWSGDDSLDQVSRGAIDPKTDSNPIAVNLGPDEMWLLFKGKDSSKLYVAVLARKKF